jgi:hypothetical protein
MISYVWFRIGRILSSSHKNNSQEISRRESRLTVKSHSPSNRMLSRSNLRLKFQLEDRGNYKSSSSLTVEPQQPNNPILLVTKILKRHGAKEEQMGTASITIFKSWMIWMMARNSISSKGRRAHTMTTSTPQLSMRTI